MTSDELDEKQGDTPAFVIACILAAAFTLQQCDHVRTLVDDEPARAEETSR